MLLSISEAARQAGTSKSAIFRAVHAGRLSATRDDHGHFQVDPAELHRAFSAERPTPRHAPRDATGNSAGSGVPPDAVRLAFETEVRLLREMLAASERRGDEIRQDRDTWRAQAERLLLAAPIIPPAPPATAPAPAPQRASWWGWWRQAS